MRILFPTGKVDDHLGDARALFAHA
jgi:hypothetical protein